MVWLCTSVLSRQWTWTCLFLYEMKQVWTVDKYKANGYKRFLSHSLSLSPSLFLSLFISLSPVVIIVENLKTYESFGSTQSYLCATLSSVRSLSFRIFVWDPADLEPPFIELSAWKVSHRTTWRKNASFLTETDSNHNETASCSSGSRGACYPEQQMQKFQIFCDFKQKLLTVQFPWQFIPSFLTTFNSAVINKCFYVWFCRKFRVWMTSAWNTFTVDMHLAIFLCRMQKWHQKVWNFRRCDSK